MIEKVNVIRDDPLKAIKMSDQEFVREEKRKLQKAGTARMGVRHRRRSIMRDSFYSIIDNCNTWCQTWFTCGRKQNSDVEELLETAILERTIIKLGSLLALGFGEA